MGVCERLVVFEHRYGRRRTEEQQLAAMRGLRSHKRFYQGRQGGLACWGHFFGVAPVFELQGQETTMLWRFGCRVSRLWRAWYSLIRRLARWHQTVGSRNGP